MKTNITPFAQRKIEEFEEKYGSFELCERVTKKDHDRLLHFLLQAITDTREETLREVKEKIEQRRKDFYGERKNKDWNVAYYDAIVDILSSLPEKKEELKGAKITQIIHSDGISQMTEPCRCLCHIKKRSEVARKYIPLEQCEHCSQKGHEK